MIHLDLFSGIGGFALAVDEVFHGTEHIFCEIDPYCQALLKRRFPGATIFGDIRTLTYSSSERFCGGGEDKTRQQSGVSWKNIQKDGVFFLTGGFPCQPFSQAGKRRGTEDNRYLWPEMLRVIREFKPTWVIAENVRGLLTIEQGMVFQQVCLDLEGEGYEVQPFIIPAVAVNAPHRRDRVWFVANRKGEFWNTPRLSSREKQKNSRFRKSNEDKNGHTSWERSWLEVATELCGVDDGLPTELDGLKLSKSRHRVERLKALGNAIVPQVAVEILKAIKMAELMEEL